MKYQIPRGLFDVLPYGKTAIGNSQLWQQIEQIAKKIASTFCFLEIRTPVFERTELFVRSVGETSDIVKKELYTFLDKKKRSMSLRPEGTAPVMRAFVENNLYSSPPPYKFFYLAPMFRYDRPQKGRYRQHHQFGVEHIGIDSYYSDAEVIDCLMQFYKKLGLKNIFLHLNSIGDIGSRESYKKALKDFLTPNLSRLSEDSKTRFEKNPLRILDSKDPQDKEILKKAPNILEFLNSSSKNYFDSLCSLLKDLNIPYELDNKLVRGLDYYNHTVFEVITSSDSRQNSLGGGGRYDHLVKDFSGPDIPGVGFGTGLERVIQTLQDQKIALKKLDTPFIYFIPLNEEAKKISFLLAHKLRDINIKTDIDIKLKKPQKALKIASEKEFLYACIIGEDEIKNNTLTLKNMSSREQKNIKLENFIDHINSINKDTNNV